MRFLHFLSFQLRLYLLRKRWLLPLPLIAFIAYRSANAVLALSQGGFGSAQPNAWDLLFVALGNYTNVYLAIGLLYIYLVCDLLPEPSLGQMLLFRLGSRRQWWWGKVLTLLMATLIYLLGITALLALISSAILPWEPGYSTAAQRMPETVNLPMDFFRKVQPGPPLLHLTQELILLALGLFFIGLVMMVIIQVSRRYFVGLLTGFLLLTGGLMSLFLNGSPSLWNYTPGAHLTYISLYPLRMIPIAYSILYWMAGITMAFIAGTIISRRQNHLAAREQEEG
ncbi:hypothetical protein [Anaerolinea sp.]|uniref:hypothetical protein n=1 Tax=Anaerolinea sp. TaxID=1872519 RepID=UPI002ACE26AD|nr:hypothetical protein [Anaerolinea sp.]